MTAEPRVRKAGRKETLVLLLGFAALVAVAGASVWLVARNAAYNDQVAGVLEAKAEIVRVLSLVQDAETGQRGFLLTGDERYLRPYETAAAQIDERLARLGTLLADEGEQMTDLARLKNAVGEKLSELSQTVTLQRAGRREDALAVVDTERGRNAMLSVRRAVALMTAREDKAFAESTGDAARSGSQLVAFMTIGLLLAAGLAVLAQVLVRRGAREAEGARAALAEANQGLEAAVSERTADLVQANDEIQRFAYIVSHDLRAPLVNVMGFTAELDAATRPLSDMIRRAETEAPDLVTDDARIAVEEDLPEAIGFIRSSTQKMDRLINAILRLSREGRRVLAPEALDMNALVGGIVDSLQHRLSELGAEITVGKLPGATSDRVAVEQIFSNLVENSIKYLKPGRPGRIAVSGRRRADRVMFEVADNGRGIDPKDHQRIFDLFRRSGTQDQPGEGIGLAHVRALAYRLGGVVECESVLGEGATFRVSLPISLRPEVVS